MSPTGRAPVATGGRRRRALKVVVLGGTGVAGTSTLRALAAAGHDVLAVVRSERSAARAERSGARATVAEDATFDIDRLAEMMNGADAAIDLRVSIPTGVGAAFPGGWRDYVRLRGPATRVVTAAARASGVQRVVRDTVTFVYRDHGDQWIDEDGAVDAPGALAANLDAERRVADFSSAGGTGVVLRFGLFYGPDDEMSLATLRQARHGWTTGVLGNREAWHSAIHTRDVGPAVVAALTVPAGVYNVTDDEPMRRGDLLDVLAAAVERRRGVRRVPTALTALAGGAVRAMTRSQRVSSARFRELTGWTPSVPSRRSGWPAAAAEALGRRETTPA